MALIDNIEMAFASLKANKMRSFLTMLGIIIGIASVIGIMTIGESLSNSVTDQLSSFGFTNMTVSVSEKSSDDDLFVRDFSRLEYTENDLISDEMIANYRSSYKDYITAVILNESVGFYNISINQKEAEVSIYGVNDEYTKTNDLQLLIGRFINQEDNDLKRNVAVVSDVFAEKLYGNINDAIGNTFIININGFDRTFYIEGIYKYENSSTLFDLSDISTNMYIPIKTAKKLNNSLNGYSQITVVANADINSDEFLNETQSFFASYYRHNDTYTVEASNLSQMLDAVSTIMSSITLAIGAIAAISLLVGGIGVMNIMLVSITERTKEIGIRKALGATNRAIKQQFIIESIIICLLGGVIGIILGLLLGYGGAALLGYKAYPSFKWIVLAVMFSMAVGIFFGYYPANKAAKLNPIDALRYE